jgi:vacuolar-type H+-ATPase subunit I/STV1
MDSDNGFFSRLGKIFKSSSKPEAPATVMTAHGEDDNGEGSHGSNGHGSSSMLQPVEASRSTFLRPWAKRDASIVQLENGFNALTGLMGAVKESLDKQNQRQDELLNVLGGLPDVLRSIPASGAAQTETLRAIADQIREQNAHQAKLGEILEKVTESSGTHKESLDELREHVSNLGDHDKNIAENLNQVGAAMQTVSEHSKTSSQVLEQMRDNINSREGELQRMLHKQGNRYTTMLAIAIFLSIAALAAVCVIGYLVITKTH